MPDRLLRLSDACVCAHVFCVCAWVCVCPCVCVHVCVSARVRACVPLLTLQMFVPPPILVVANAMSVCASRINQSCAVCACAKRTFETKQMDDSAINTVLVLLQVTYMRG